jgi:DNA-binding NarL/FixJ family response regulator
MPSAVSDPAVTVVVADDDPLARRLISHTLTKAGVRVVDEAVSSQEAVMRSLLHCPDVLVLDIFTPGREGIDAIRRLRVATSDRVAVLALSSGTDVDLAIEAFRAGAQGYLSKEVGLDPLPQAVRALADGEAVIPRRLGSLLLQELRAGRSDTIGLRPVRSPLTPREWEVFDLLCEGHTTETIAARLVLSTETVRSHVKRILRKLHVRNRAEAVAQGPRLRAVS